MGSSCTTLAHVRNSKGEIVESRLFKDLLHYTSNDRRLSKKYYAIGTDKGFLDKAKESDLFKTDENGEITFGSLKAIAKIDFDEDKAIQILNKDLGTGIYSYDEALRRIENFNEHNDFSDKFLATLVPTGRGNYYISVVPKASSTGKNSLDAQSKLHNIVRNKEVERRIKEILSKYKVSIKFLEDTNAENRFSSEEGNYSKVEGGFYNLIQLVHGQYTTDIMAEEAGHFAVAALGDNPLVQRLEKLLENPTAQMEALGEEEFNRANLGDKPAREVAGRLVGKALQRKLGSMSPVKVLANRIANLAKRIFYKINGNELRYASVKAEQLANRIAYQFAEGNSKFSVQNAINIGETMRSSDYTVDQALYKKVMDEFGRMVKQLSAISDNNLTKQMEASEAMALLSGIDENSGKSALQMAGKLADGFAFDGMVQALVQINDYIGDGKQIDQLIQSVDLDNPSSFYSNMARNGKNLRQARTFLRSAEVMITTVKQSLGMDLTLPNGIDVRNVQYKDEDGNVHSVNLERLLDNAQTGVLALLNGTTSKPGLAVKEREYFIRFCEDVYGSKYITMSVGKVWGKNVWNESNDSPEKDVYIRDAVLGTDMNDIDIFHAYLGSMANNPDIVGQIIDKTVKTANKIADDETLRYRDKLRVLQARAEKMGLDYNDLIERDEDGNITGNLITPPVTPGDPNDIEEAAIYEAYDSIYGYVPSVNYGNWERDRLEYKKKLWEELKAEYPDLLNMSGFAKGYLWDKKLKVGLKYWNEGNLAKGIEAHSVKVQVKDPQTGEVLYTKWVPSAKYESDAWSKVKDKYKDVKGDSVAKWVHDYLKLKESLDAKLPFGSTVSYRLPQFRGTLMNSVRNAKPLEEGSAKGLKAFGKTFGRRAILESFVETADDTEYGDMNSMNSPDEEWLGTKLNYEDERAARIPTFGINKLQNMTDLSTDLCHSMLAYASMACSYGCLKNVVDAIEVGTEVLYNRDIEGEHKTIDKTVEKVSTIGEKFRKRSGIYEARYHGAKNRAYGRYLKYLDKQVYGISATYYGLTNKKGKTFLLSKIASNISSLGGALFLKGNVLGGAVNTLTGFNNIMKEAMVADEYDPKDWLSANTWYFQHCPQMWMQFGNQVKDDKMSLFLTAMNSSGNNREHFRNWHPSKSKWENIYRELGYLPYSSGDHYMQAMSYLAVAHGTKLYDTDGTYLNNLWEAYERTPNTDEFNAYSEGHSLKFKKFCPLASGDITSEIIEKEGVYLKDMDKNSKNFEEWLIWQDSDFKDEGYKSTHISEYNSFKSKYYNMSREDLIQFNSMRFDILSGILSKVENYMKNAGGLLSSTISFTVEEQDYLDLKDLKIGYFDSILHTVRDDIYNIIWSNADCSAYMDKCREVNNRLHGIYNNQDKTAFHQQWYTNAFLAMKGWALGYLEMMYSPQHYSIALGKNTEGFVNTASKIFINTISGLFGNDNSLSFKDMFCTMFWPWGERSQTAMLKAGFSEEQNMNARRMTVSAFLMGLLLALRLATAPPDKDSRDDDEEDVLTGLIHYLAMRTLLEQEAFLYIPEIITQSGQLLDFLPVGVAALVDIGELSAETIGAWTHSKKNSKYFYTRDSKDGRYKEGDSKALHHLERLIPYWKSVWAIQHPYEAAKNYNFGRKMRRR